MTAEEMRALIKSRPMASTQFVIVAICLFITLIDGFDILSISFVAPAIAREWELSPQQLGVVFSSGLAGMTLGALCLSWIGDLYGRRTAIMLLLALIGSGMLLTATAHSFAALSGFRLLTGLGIGAIASNTGTIILEFIPLSRRTSALALVLIGTPIGALIGGSVALFVMGMGGWRAVFVWGAVLTLALIPAVYLRLPESIEFLLGRRPNGALERLNAVLSRLKILPLDQMPPPGEKLADRKARIVDVVRGDLLKRTVPIGLIQFAYIFAYYSFVNWVPKLVTQIGVSDRAGVSVAMLINIGGIAAAIPVGMVALKFGLVRTTVAGFLAMAAFLVCFGATPPVVWLLGGVAMFEGFAMFSTQISLFSLVAMAYPASVRATGVGFAFAIGRLGSVLGPLMVGVLVQRGLGRLGLCVLIALPVLLASAMVPLIPPEDRPSAGR